jgi:hypothetical protein
LGEAGVIRGRGLREIKGRLYYSAAWLDDPSPETGQIVPLRAFVASQAHASTRRRRPPHNRTT